MVTTAALTQWRSDIPIREYRAAGLLSPSVVRLKLFTLADELVIGTLGQLAQSDRAPVDRAMIDLLST